VTEFLPNRTGLLSGVSERIGRWTLEHRQPLLLHRHAPSSALQPGGKNFFGIFEDNDLLSVLSVPLIKKGQIIGVLNLSKLTDPTPFNEVDQELMTVLCGQAAVAVENARLFREVQQRSIELEEASFNAIRALAQALETKDWRAWDYSDRFMDYAQAIADRLNLFPNEVRQLKYAILLHDIGLIGVRDALLKKAGKFGPEEYEEMKNHPFVGAQIVKRIKFLDDVVPVIYHHHERWDGKGYPDGLAGEKIPICSRILAVLDAFEAMTSDRPYRKAMPLPVVISELQRCSSTQFDPTVVETFLQVLDQKGIGSISTGQ
jgi:HD-GYP domain-containing protein (c-di-GMP phosphodiesterase class II)